MSLPDLRKALVGAWLALLVLPAPLAARDALPPWPAPGDSVLANDPAVVWGRLANGLRYAVLPSRTPPGKISLRLLVEAGSLMEDEAQRGLAHFVEHMAFEGSANLPPGALVAYLQRAGLAFGPDTNASTGFDTTVYQLDLPRNDEVLVGDALGILGEIAGRLLLPAVEVEAERGVILSEKRVRDTPDARLFEATLKFLLPGTRYADRLPIGLEEVIRTAPRDRLVEFYRDHYTPRRTVVVVAGDVRPASVVPAIERHFAAFRQPTEAPAEPDAGTAANRGLGATLVNDPGLPTTLSLNAVLPHDPRPDGLAKQSDQLRELLATAMLGRRLDSIALRPKAPFARAAVGTFELPPVARVPTIRLVATRESWRGALTAGEQELRRALEFGFGDTELVEMLAIFRSGLEAAGASALTRDSGELAEQLVEAITDERVFTSPATDLAVFDQLTRDLRPADLDRALRNLWQAREPRIILAGPVQLAEPEAEILEAYRNSRAVPVSPPVARIASSFAYGDFGRPSGVAGTEQVQDLGITRVTFANGVRLDLKPTEFEADTVHVAVRFGNGRIGIPPDRPGLDLLAKQAFVAGGLGRHGIEEIERILAARQVGADLVVGDSGLVLTGRTTRRELPLQLDLLAAYVTDPGYRPEAMDRYRQQLEAAYARMAATPEGTVPGPVELLLHGGDPRFALPAKAEAAKRTLGELRLWLDPMLRHGPMQVVVVGDIDPAAVVAEVGRTFGALPPRGSAPDAPPPEIRLPTMPEPVRLTHGGPADRALALAYWPTTGQGHPRTEIGLDLVADILGDRLLREAREREGATYSPEVYSAMSLALPGYGRIGAALDVTAGDAPRLGRLIGEVAAGMRAGGITPDEFDRALQPRLAQAKLALQDNAYWLQGVLLRAQKFPQILDNARSLVADHEGQTLASVQALATRYLDPGRALTVLVLPEAVVEGAASGASAGGPAPTAVR